MLIDSIDNKKKILNQFLQICIFEGWNDETLKLAFKKAEIKVKFVPFIFENGCLDMANFFIRELDEELLEDTKNIDFSQMKIRDKIKNLVKIRLEINEQYKPQIQQLIKFYSKPKNTSSALKNSFKTSDLMWKIAGDNATDFNFYSKRLILAKIYLRVLTYFIKDNSENHQKTFNLLDEEIEKVMKFGALKFKAKNYCDKIYKLLKDTVPEKKPIYENPKDFIKNLPFFRLYK
ncbi:MAG: ubiquinone biosynthesis protein COQ9 [Lentimonas sp.]|jgi:ubiquinone biosynthesis protein COQ9